MLPLSSNVWIGEAVFERLAPGRYVARVKVYTPDDSRYDMFMLPPGYEPSSDRGRSVSDELVRYYTEEGF